MGTGRNQRDYKRAATTEIRWATLAHREGMDNLRQMRRALSTGHPVLAKMYRQEASWDFFWEHRRERVANRFARLAERK